MTLHNYLHYSQLLYTKNIAQTLYNILMIKNTKTGKIYNFLSKYLVNLFNTIRDFNILDILNESISINYPKKVHSINLQFSYNKTLERTIYPSTFK